MRHLADSLRRKVFGISPDETRFDRRGFQATEPTRQTHLETAGRSFIQGYNEAIAAPRSSDFAPRLESIEPKFRGFAFEGAAMALALLDLVTPWNRGRFDEYCQSQAGDRHWYMLYIGAGWAIARVPWARRRFEQTLARFHPLYRWLALDGYGFHQGFFYTTEFVEEQTLVPGLSPHGQRVFDQGLGRSMWFSKGANPERIAAAITRFRNERQADLWSGVGLAASYAGGVERDILENLRGCAVGYELHLAQGAAFAAKARERAGDLVPHAVTACDVFCRCPVHEAAAATDFCLADLPSDSAEPSYQVWRRRIREHFGGNTSNQAAPSTAISAEV